MSSGSSVPESDFSPVSLSYFLFFIEICLFLHCMMGLDFSVFFSV